MMPIFNYKLIHRKEMVRQRNDAAEIKDRLAALQLIISQAQSGQWAQAIDKAKSLHSDPLTNGMIKLIENQKETFEKEANRNWINNGLLELNKVIGSNHEDINHLANDVINSIANYAQARQGALFVVNDDTANVLLQMRGAYAYQRREKVGKSVSANEGLIGQCYREKDPIDIVNVPLNYTKITSGLGEVHPKFLLIIQLKGNKENIGVCELAFLKNLQLHEREFLIKACDLIAKAIINLQSHNKTLNLLALSESTTTELKRNQEELRLSVDKMQVIHQELLRKNDELQHTRNEIELMTRREKELIESKLETQQLIHDKVISTLKSKIEKLQGRLKEISHEPENNSK
ncbi:hypothetical protein WSM22_39090 [Cytophagales bacterium WSM2-2]|nr:hypothetical protein WSM22_39090 [Cytophagales bacterium WSM2-2]